MLIEPLISSVLSELLFMNGQTMKNYLKIVVALVVIIGALVWVVDATRTLSYSGTDLNFGVGQGAVTVNNPQDSPVPVQLVSPGTRTFSVVSAIDGVSGSSVVQGTGSARTQLLELALPSGESQFTVTRGSNVSLVTPPTTRLDVSVQSQNETNTRTTLIVAAVVILAALYYISKTTGHRWLSMIRGQIASTPVVLPVVQSASAGQGAEMRAYGDNRADASKP